MGRDLNLMQNDERPKGSVGLGAALGVLVHVPGLFLCGVGWSLIAGQDLAEAMAGLGMFFGWSQVLYMLPLGIFLWVRGQKAMLKGLAIVVGIGFLVTSACFGLIMGSL